MYVTRIGGRIVSAARAPLGASNELVADDDPALLAFLQGRQLDQVKRDKVLAVGREMAARMAAGFTYQGKVYQLDDLAQGRITALALKAERVLAQRSGVTWDAGFVFIAADNSSTPFTAAEFGPFADAASNVVIRRRYHAHALKDQILAAGSAEGVEAVNVTAGWD